VNSSEFELTSWRGPNGNGVYNEQDLLDKWPSEGPEILWVFEGLGSGFSSPSFAHGKIYITGMIESQGYVFVMDYEGKVLWKVAYGPEFVESYEGSRSSVTVAGEMMYLYSGLGELICMSSEDGTEIWRKSVFKEMDGKNIVWGVTETVVVNGDLVYCTPGGKKNNVVALNRFTGEVVWSCSGEGDLSAYCTPVFFKRGQRELLVTITANHILGIDAQTGELLWSRDQTNRWSVHANTPIYHDGALYCFSGYGRGGVRLNLSADGSRFKEVWTNETLDNRIGGAVLVDGFIYGSGDRNRAWQCIDWTSGESNYSSTEIGKGTVIYADGKLYCYSDRGELALVEANPDSFNVLSETKVKFGTAQHWAHPVIFEGILYIRHGDALIAYIIK